MKTWVEDPKESVEKYPEKDKTEYSRWKKTQKMTKQNIALGKITVENSSGGRPAGRPPTVGFPTVGDSGRPLFPTKEPNSVRSGRPGRSITDSKALTVGRSPGRPKCTNALWCMSVDRSIDRQSNFALPTIDRSVNRIRAKSKILKSFWNQSFSNKITFDF